MLRKFFTGLVAVGAMLVPVAISAPVQAAPTSLVPIVSPTDQLAPPPVNPKGTQPKGVVAPKGNPTKAGDAKAAREANSRAALLSGPYFHYALARQTLAVGEKADGQAANLHIQSPYLDPADLVNGVHSLGELAVSDRAGNNVVEVGWTKDDGVCGSTTTGGVTTINTCMFVFWWKNGVPQCYNGCGFTEYTANCSVAGQLCPGDNMTSLVNQQKRFQISRTSNAWWLAYDGVYIGYYLDTLWTGATPSGPAVTNFKYGEMFSVFYEVASGDPSPCTDMGSGYLGTDPSLLASRMGSIILLNPNPSTIVSNFPASAPWKGTGATPTVAGVYDVLALSTQTARGGGPGWNAAGTAPGTRGGC